MKLHFRKFKKQQNAHTIEHNFTNVMCNVVKLSRLFIILKTHDQTNHPTPKDCHSSIPRWIEIHFLFKQTIHPKFYYNKSVIQ